MYKLEAREVLILAVIHSARDWKFWFLVIIPPLQSLSGQNRKNAKLNLNRSHGRLIRISERELDKII
jgi:hypothetical protein